MRDKLLVAAAGIVAVTGLIVIGGLNTSQLRAQSEAAVAPKFEVASIKPCQGERQVPGGGQPGPIHHPEGSARVAIVCSMPMASV